jgi:hypothetical protein
MNGVWLLPTKGRIPNLRRFLSAAREMGGSTPGWILVNDDELEASRFLYEQALRLAPAGWELMPVKATCYGDALRYVWPDIKGKDWVGLVSDDLVPCSGNWDMALLKQVAGWNVVSSNDGWQAQTGNIHHDRLHGAIVWSGALLRCVGWMFPEGLTHIFHDDVWETIGRETGCWQVRTDIMVKHLHEALEGRRGPTMDPSSDLWKHDESIFKEWLSKDKDSCVAKVRALMESQGLRAVTPNFAGVKLMIGTPCIDGRYESSYMISLFNTMKMMGDAGVTCQMAEEKFTADICMARAKIFSAFLRSDCTHLLTIDADMAWEPSAIIRLFHAKKDFVSVAGPKKRYPLSFAANFTDANGNPINLVFDQESGTMEVGEIGSAFCLISRNCAKRLADAYPELAFLGVTGEKEYAVYNPIVARERGGRYYSEDFAFCLRWRTIGGRVYMIPDVKLSHTGSHTFTGSFVEAAAAQQAQQEAASKQAAATGA